MRRRDGRTRGLGWGAVLLALTISGCEVAASPARPGNETSREPRPRPGESFDDELRECEASARAIQRAAPLPGAPAFEARRGEILGRARGEPLWWAREPRPTPDAELPTRVRALRTAFARQRPLARVSSLLRALRQDRPALRAVLLREGYLYATDPVEAIALTSRVTLPALFDEPELWLMRGDQHHLLRRVAGRVPEYRHADGPAAGRLAELLLGDRVAVRRQELEPPLHRDLSNFARREQAARVVIEHATEDALLARVRYEDLWARAVVDTNGAELKLRCLLAPANERASIHAWQRATAWRPRAFVALRGAIDAAVEEALPFDRPRGEKTAERDGRLRPEWRWAYRSGGHTFTHDGESYPVYDALGRPVPPQMCVDFVIESFERAAGTWYRRRGEAPGRTKGALDLDDHGIENRHAVLAFEEFAKSKPGLFAHRRFAGAERVPFQDRSRFFSFLIEHADLFHAGDVVAIQGKKADGLVHQHAILIEGTDPVTGMPHALADQMKRPRRRTWEGIMAEAPLRSLLYRVQPTDTLLMQLDPDAAPSGTSQTFARNEAQ